MSDVSVESNNAHPSFERWISSQSDPVVDADEEIFLLYAAASEHGNGLGFIHKQPLLDIDFVIQTPHTTSPSAERPGRRQRRAPVRQQKEVQVSACIHQDPSSLASEAGNTSAVAWRASLQLAKSLLLQHHNPSLCPSIIDLERLKSSSLLELGSGTGMLSVLLHKLTNHWTATDRAAALPLLRKNLSSNKVSEATVSVEEVDWEEIARLHTRGKSHKDLGWSSPDVILAGPNMIRSPVDVVFNQALALPLLQTLSFFTTSSTLVLVASELRESSMLQNFLEHWLALDQGRWSLRRLHVPSLPTDLQQGHEGPIVLWAGCRN